jgi:hypothetical protein
MMFRCFVKLMLVSLTVFGSSAWAADSPATAAATAEPAAAPAWTPAGWGPHGKPLYYFMVFANPVPGKEQEFDTWYERIHAPVMIESGDFVWAQRFTYSPVQLGLSELPKRQHLVIFAIETNDIAKTATEVNARLRMPRNVRGEALDYGSIMSTTYEAIDAPITQKQAQRVLAEETAAGRVPPADATPKK